MTRAPDTCQVWWATSGGSTGEGLLSDAERSRAGRFRCAEGRLRFVTARVLLRLLLADRLGVPPAAVPLVAGCRVCGASEHGRLRLDGDPTEVSFSVTRRGARVGVAMTDGRAVGVDVETADDRGDPARAALAAEALGPLELAAYRRLPVADRGRAMTRWWTRKEAVLKATGDGLGFPPAKLRVSAPGSPAALVAWEEPSAATASRPPVRLQDVDPAPGYVGCVAVLGSHPIRVAKLDGDEVLRGGEPVRPSRERRSVGRAVQG
jgi:4'-phosphopantetheinyl transferase